MPALEALVDPEACGRPGETPQMQRDRRKAMMDRWRELMNKQDLTTLKFEEVVDVAKSKAIAKADLDAGALAALSPAAREVGARLADGEILVVGKTSAPKVGDAQVFAKEVVLRIRQTGGVWRIVEAAA